MTTCHPCARTRDSDSPPGVCASAESRPHPRGDAQSSIVRTGFHRGHAGSEVQEGPRRMQLPTAAPSGAGPIGLRPSGAKRSSRRHGDESRSREGALPPRPPSSNEFHERAPEDARVLPMCPVKSVTHVPGCTNPVPFPHIRRAAAERRPRRMWGNGTGFRFAACPVFATNSCRTGLDDSTRV